MELYGSPSWEKLADLGPLRAVHLHPDDEDDVLGIGEPALADIVLQAVDVPLVALVLGAPFHVIRNLQYFRY